MSSGNMMKAMMAIKKVAPPSIKKRICHDSRCGLLMNATPYAMIPLKNPLFKWEEIQSVMFKDVTYLPCVKDSPHWGHCKPDTHSGAQLTSGVEPRKVNLDERYETRL